MATQYNITLQDLIVPARISGTITLPSAEDVVYSPTGATVTLRDPLSDYRNTLATLGGNARYEQFRLNNGTFVVWSPDPNAGPVDVAIQESDPWNGVIRTRTFRAVLQLPSYRYSPQGDTINLVLLYCDCYVNTNGIRDCF
ncbi:MAG: hypothetical protein KatS3mg051_1550 [Anaerolineae bacterium]|nr:MAG: hypothetical protein KatS3mg051_1550 [Anaerolineae bacterium]